MKNPKPTTPLMRLILPELLELAKSLKTLRTISNALDLKHTDDMPIEEYIRLNVNQINRAISRILKSIKAISQIEVVSDLYQEEI